MKRILYGGVAIFFIVACIFGYTVSQRPLKKNEKTVTVEKGSVSEKATAMGVLVPRTTVNIKSQIRGIVTAFSHDEGDFVTKGSKLLEVKPEPTPEEYAKYKQTFEVYQSKEQNLKRNLDRLQELWKKKMISSKDYDETKQLYDEAVLGRKLAEQNVNLIEKGTAQVAGKQIENTLYSPIDGYILKRNVEVGDAVVPLSDAQAGTVLFTIAKMNDMLFKGAVNEIDVGKIHDKMTAKIEIGALPKLELKGTVTRIALQSEGFESNVSFKEEEQKQARYRLDIDGLQIPADIRIRAGFSATAEIELAIAKDVIVIPERLLRYEGDKATVMKKTKTSDKPVSQTVVVGISDGVNAEIKSGLQVGDQLVDAL